MKTDAAFLQSRRLGSERAGGSERRGSTEVHRTEASVKHDEEKSFFAARDSVQNFVLAIYNVRF